ncbi:MAG: sigma-54 dependent transcriptional regulator [Candidatus Cloacimonetes bacterium]|nr:sigma-54 dependent transcriptional regulator [Candidatus Cloacimonadota bacterium]MDY0229981.1 sigma-54 dependent transcriptional regulator [Candidatus Cloacimonadaceae bacterium]
MTEKTHLLVLDDETLIRDGLHEHFSNLGYRVSCCGYWQDAQSILSKCTIHIVILDVVLPGLNRKMDGMDIMKMIKNDFPEIEIIMISGHATVDRVIDAWRAGAIMFLEKPYNLDDITLAVQRAEHYSLRWVRLHQLEEEIVSYAMEKDLGTRVIAHSPQMKNCLKLAKKYAQNSHSVLLTGESGTGKEILAKLIHYASNRRTNQFCAINVNAIPHELFESTLFGYVKGAFTGANQTTEGLIDKAENGTLFLDEIGDLSCDLQVKLLRVIENREFYRVGANKPIKTNAKFIFATMYNLKTKVETEQFRNDLYYRISELDINIPPLRERKADIKALTEYFLCQISDEEGRKTVPTLTEEGMKALVDHKFSGNIRELKKIIRQAVLSNENVLIGSNELFPDLNNHQTTTSSKRPCKTCEAYYIRQVLKTTGCNASQTMKLLGISRTAFYQKMRNYKITVSNDVG